MRRALLTGATSFPGLALAERLLKVGVEIHALVRSSTDTLPLARRGVVLHLIDGGAQSIDEAVRAVRPDVTYHLANLYLRAPTPDEITQLVQTNVTLGTALLDSLVRRQHRNFVNVGTYVQFYKSESPRPFSLYAATKEAFETILSYHSDLGLNATTLILFDTYGPGDTRAKLVPSLIKALENGTPIPLPDREVIMDLTYRSDVAEALYLAGAGLIGRPKDWQGKRLAVSGFRHSIAEVVDVLETVAGRKIEKRWGEWKVPERHIDVPWNGPRPLGWSALVPLDEGLRQTLIAGPHAP